MAALAIVSTALLGLAIVGAVLGGLLLLMPSLRAAPTRWFEAILFPDANQVDLRAAKRRDKGAGGGAAAHHSVYRILAFGDSLTEGFTESGNAFHPYAKRLGDLLWPQMPKGWYLEIEEQGESGERVLMGMHHRLQRTLEEHVAAGRPYDWVLLLAGINDLAGERSAATDVLEGLDGLVQRCLSHGANVMLMTLLEVAGPEPDVEQQRLLLNASLKRYVAERSWDKAAAAGGSTAAVAASPGGQGGQQTGALQRRAAPAVHMVDLAMLLPFESLDSKMRWELWDDGVHLSPAGYDWMGGVIATSLLPLMHAEIGSPLDKGTDGAAPAEAVAAAAPPSAASRG